jgi:hypothetical protein
LKIEGVQNAPVVFNGLSAFLEFGQVASRRENLPQALVLLLEAEPIGVEALKSGGLELEPAVSLPFPFYDGAKRDEGRDADKDEHKPGAHVFSLWKRGTNRSAPVGKLAPKTGPDGHRQTG